MFVLASSGLAGRALPAPGQGCRREVGRDRIRRGGCSAPLDVSLPGDKAAEEHMIDLGLAGKIAVVAGAGYIPERAGHGRLCSLRLAQAGASVACMDVDAARANEIADEVRSLGVAALPIVADMTDQADVARAFDEADTALGPIDVCVDIIGGAKWAGVLDTSCSDWDWTLRNNLSHVFYVFQAAARRMAATRRGGSIIAIASVDGIHAATMHAPYGAAKAGVISLVKTFAAELGCHGIRVNAVAPGNVGTGNEDQPDNQWAVNPVNPLAPPRTRDVANAVLFLASSLAERVTGQTLVVDGGASSRDLWGIDETALQRFIDGD